MAHPLNVVRVLCASASLAVLAGCMTQPTMPTTAAPPPAPDTTVYFYPAQGQTPDRQGRDKYECNNWAVHQSGFDPSAPTTPPHLRTQVAAGPPAGSGVATGAIGGAALGAIASPPWHAGQGALFGALAGAVVGGVAESAARQQSQEQAQQQARNEHMAQLEGQALNFRRAMSACLEARGYNVR
jgi:hypothetical protein